MGKTWQSFAAKMMEFKFECIGEKLTDDEEKIGNVSIWLHSFVKKCKYAAIKSDHVNYFTFPFFKLVP
jgi:hypothetical protein